MCCIDRLKLQAKADGRPKKSALPIIHLRRDDLGPLMPARDVRQGRGAAYYKVRGQLKVAQPVAGASVMGVFDFMLALYSIIAGLAISVLVKGIARMIKGRERLHLYWVHTGWLTFLFVVHVVNWFALWPLRYHTSWTALEAVLLLLIPISPSEGRNFLAAA